ncbi:hypothetical protein [Roseimicrobium sp. ORNL1]|uniref:hypothetical protein n=1 Tax=Roseimicrobium sp. ORNL1 TaxID=2711231 RepID=UPI0013E0F658|nr:hypothetical protein [Roseimicrobium sp. ORNL1]QIF05424.1 hypothetical protein G5S37_29275 [Roseimicrobium sp. ORNL1]
MRKYRRVSLIVVVVLAIAVTAGWWHWFRADYSWLALQDDPMKRLATVPDLAPQLTKDEVFAASVEWRKLLEEIKSTPDPDGVFLEGTSLAWKLLSPELEGATKVTLYSIHPGDFWISGKEDKGRGELSTLPEFHERPVLGSITLERPEDVKKWSHFLQGQIIPGNVSQCVFQPRHGFRFTTPRGEVDLIMCFACGDMTVDEGTISRSMPKLRADVPSPKGIGYSPRLSPLVRDVVNALFDKQGIRRDREESRKVDD